MLAQSLDASPLKIATKKGCCRRRQVGRKRLCHTHSLTFVCHIRNRTLTAVACCFSLPKKRETIASVCIRSKAASALHSLSHHITPHTQFLSLAVTRFPFRFSLVSTTIASAFFSFHRSLRSSTLKALSLSTVGDNGRFARIPSKQRGLAGQSCSVALSTALSFHTLPPPPCRRQAFVAAAFLRQVRFLTPLTDHRSLAHFLTSARPLGQIDVVLAACSHPQLASAESSTIPP